jgi:lipoprotein-releasing system ATP-binding protein
MNNSIVLQTNLISKSFHDPMTVRVLKDISFSIREGEFVSIIGKSGCGKSTLLYILSTMDTDYEGELQIVQEVMRDKNEKQLTHIRNEKIGFVFQFHYLLNEFTVLENVMLPGLKQGKFSKEEVRQRATELLNLLNIKQLINKKARQLSGGEKQRVTIARALINNPRIVMCDEPTENLDKMNSSIVFNTLKQLAEEQHLTLLVATHDIEFAKKTHRTIEMKDGKIITSACYV